MNINEHMSEIAEDRAVIIASWLHDHGINIDNESDHFLIQQRAGWTQIRFTLVDYKRRKWRYANPSLVIDTLTNRSFTTYLHVTMKGQNN